MTAADREWQSILGAVIARPADGLPRKIAADWLDEHGQGERAEFIRIQVERARLNHNHLSADRTAVEQPDRADLNCECHTLRRREREIAGRNHFRLAQWLVGNPAGWFAWSGESGYGWSIPQADGSPSFPSRVRHVRGFVEEIILPAAGWLAHADALLKAAPLRRVVWTTEPGIRMEGGDAWLFSEAASAHLPGVFDGMDYRDIVLNRRGGLLGELCRRAWPTVEVVLRPVERSAWTYTRGEWRPADRTDGTVRPGETIPFEAAGRVRE